MGFRSRLSDSGIASEELPDPVHTVRREPVASRADAVLSCQIRELFERFTPPVNPFLLDEASLDVAGSERLSARNGRWL